MVYTTTTVISSESPNSVTHQTAHLSLYRTACSTSKSGWMNEWMNEQFNWYKNQLVHKDLQHLHVSKQATKISEIILHYLGYKHKTQWKKKTHTQNQYSARIKCVKSTVFSFLLNTAILETLIISNGRLFQISICKTIQKDV